MPEPKLSAKNQARWELPLDRYSAQIVDLPGIAVRVMVQACIEKRGWPWAVTTAEAGAKPGESWNDARQKLFSVALAEKYGYGNSSELDLSAPQQAELRAVDKANREIDADADSDIDECFSRGQKAIGLTPNAAPWDLANSLAVQAYNASLVTKPVLAATATWRKCMAGVGVPDLPRSPDLMPSPSMIGSGRGVDEPWTKDVVDPEERRVAVADAKCQESSGYFDAAYTAEWDAEVKLLRENADELERYDKQMQAMNRKARKVIAHYAPSAK